jgi:SAM-dependent methyltransferase
MSNRDYNNFDLYYEELLTDIYPQPIDDGHLKAMMDIITRWIIPINPWGILDAGCGQGDAEDIFKSFGIPYLGIAYGGDVEVAKYLNRRVIERDFTFTGLPSMDFSLVFARHSLEHSSCPLMTLMEWWRVSERWLCLVIPNPEHYKYVGRNHYSVMNATQAAWILRRAGWKLRKVYIGPEEMWYLCEKEQRIGYEGWATAPLNNHIYEFERDLGNIQGEVDVKQYFESRGWNGLF